MYFSRIMFGSASLLALSMCLALQTSSADVQTKVAHLTLPCTITLTVDPTQGGVDLADAYICSGTTVTWAPNGHTFHVFFKKNKCPFASCKHIHNGDASRTVLNLLKFTVFEYGIVVDDEVFDPHVVGGGGTDENSRNESKDEPR